MTFRSPYQITIDADNNLLQANISEAEIMRRRGKHVIPALRVNSGALWKYAKLVSSASEGCVTDES